MYRVFFPFILLFAYSLFKQRQETFNILTRFDRHIDIKEYSVLFTDNYIL